MRSFIGDEGMVQDQVRVGPKKTADGKRKGKRGGTGSDYLFLFSYGIHKEPIDVNAGTAPGAIEWISVPQKKESPL